MNLYIKLGLGAVLGLLIGIGGTLFTVKTTIENQPEPAFHEHADFAMYLNGERVDFSLDEFMSVTPCKVVQAPFGVAIAQAHGATQDSLKDDVHLHDNIGNVVHVHAEGIDWADFFTSIGMSFTGTTFQDHLGNITTNDEENAFRFFVNGEEVDMIDELEIRNNDKVLISYGPRDRVYEDFAFELASISNDACYYSEECLHRGDAPYESCGVTIQPSWLETFLRLK